jgi:hypothetical protein
MPYLTTGYAPAEIPAPATEDFGVTTVDGGGGTETAGYLAVNDQRQALATIPPGPPELRTAGTNDRQAYHPAFAFSVRTDTPDRLDWNHNTGVHVAQVPGAAISPWTGEPEPPMYGNTWRLEPVPADSGQFIGATEAR